VEGETADPSADPSSKPTRESALALGAYQAPLGSIASRHCPGRSPCSSTLSCSVASCDSAQPSIATIAKQHKKSAKASKGTPIHSKRSSAPPPSAAPPAPAAPPCWLLLRALLPRAHTEDTLSLWVWV
jgi:hypothetical protein